MRTAVPTPTGRSMWIGCVSAKVTDSPYSVSSSEAITSFWTSPYRWTEISWPTGLLRTWISGSCSASCCSATYKLCAVGRLDDGLQRRRGEELPGSLHRTTELIADLDLLQTSQRHDPPSLRRVDRDRPAALEDPHRRRLRGVRRSAASQVDVLARAQGAREDPSGGDLLPGRTAFDLEHRALQQILRRTGCSRQPLADALDQLGNTVAGHRRAEVHRMGEALPHLPGELARESSDGQRAVKIPRQEGVVVVGKQFPEAVQRNRIDSGRHESRDRSRSTAAPRSV